MLVGTRGPPKGVYSGKAAAMRSLSSSGSSDDVALPTRVVTERATRYVGRVSDDDFETSSYEETSESSFSDNSEEFVPLVFGYINDNPRRRAGAPARGQLPAGVSEEVNSQSSLSDASPLEIFYERANAKRNYGKGARRVEENEVRTSLSSYDDDTDHSEVSDALPVAFERKKRVRTVGHVQNPKYEVSDSESAISLSDEDEAPLNAQLIHTLVKRLRNPLDDVTPEAFDYVDFNDANFREVLEPLLKIKACIERRASQPLKQNDEVNREIKAAVEALPSAKAIAVKVQMVKSRQLRPAQPAAKVLHAGEEGPHNAEILQGLVARLKEDPNDVALRDFEKVDWADRSFEPELAPLRQIRAYMEAKAIITEKPAEAALRSGSVLDDKIKVAIMALPANEAMAAKVRAVKSRQLKANAGQNGARDGGEAVPAVVEKERTAVASAAPAKPVGATVRAVQSRPMSRAQTNGEEILGLIKRLRSAEEPVPLRAFEQLDWNDRNFARELEPLQQIRMYLEAKETLKEMPAEVRLSNMPELDNKIKTAILSLPPEKAVAVKIQMLREREMAQGTDEPKPQAVKVGKLSAPASTVRKMKDSVLVSGPKKKSKSKEGKLSASSSQVAQVGTRIMSSQARTCAVKESTALSEPAKKVRRARNSLNNHSISFLKVEETAPGEIVDQDQNLAETSGVKRLYDEDSKSPTSNTPRDVSRVPSRPAQARERRHRTRRLNQTVSFREAPHEEAGAISEEADKLSTTKRKAHRRRAAHRPGRNLSISSLPDMEAGEVVEEPELPDKPAAKEAAAPVIPPPPPRSLLKPSGGVKKRRARVSGNNRSCSFTEVAMDEATEVADTNAGSLKGTAEEPAASRADSFQAKPSFKLVRRRRADEQNGSTPASPKGSAPPSSVKRSAPQDKNAEGGDGATARGKGRRANVRRPRSANASVVEDEANGEIVELADEAERLYSPSNRSTPAPQTPATKVEKARELPAASRSGKRAPKAAETVGAAKKRRQRVHMSKELSISAIPEDGPGEIVEDERDTFASTAGSEGLASSLRRSLPGSNTNRAFPAVGAGSRRQSARGSFRKGDHPLSSVRSSMNGPRVAFAPEAEPDVMPSAASATPLPPPQGQRRSSEATPRVARSLPSSAGAGGKIPPLRSSR